MRQPENVRPQPSLLAKVHELPQACEAWIEKDRAKKEVIALTKALLRVPDVQQDGHHTVYLKSPDERDITIKSFHTGQNGASITRIDYWELAANTMRRRKIEYSYFILTGSFFGGLSHYREYNASGRKILDVKCIHNSQFIASKEGARVPFDSALQSQVYCEVANIFIMARQEIERLPSKNNFKAKL